MHFFHMLGHLYWGESLHHAHTYLVAVTHTHIANGVPITDTVYRIVQRIGRHLIWKAAN